MTTEQLRELHDRCQNNRAAIEAAAVVGCFFCCSVSPSTEVTDFSCNCGWCPLCGIDSLIPDCTDLALLRELGEIYGSAD